MAQNLQIAREKDNQVKHLTCGLVMPISPIDGCSAEHWAEVKLILQDAIEGIDQPKFEARLVSDADDVGVIQKRIVQAIYSSDIVVCDVSGRNPNVMFELGMRLAFDKPTVIVKDDKTDYSFDTGVVEHLTYPRDLRFHKIQSFKKVLAEKIEATHRAAEDPNHASFLKSFGTFHIAKVEEKPASGDQVIMDALADIQRELTSLRRSQFRTSRNVGGTSRFDENLLSAVNRLRRELPSLDLKNTDEVIAELLKRDPEILNSFSSKNAFDVAMQSIRDQTYFGVA